MGYKSDKLELCECGSEVELNGANGGYTWYAKCLGCGKSGQEFSAKTEREGQKLAIEWWNNRNINESE